MDKEKNQPNIAEWIIAITAILMLVVDILDRLGVI
jgi:hypothetical protein